MHASFFSLSNFERVSRAESVIEVTRFPSHPKILFAINSHIDKGEPDFDQIEDLIKQDFGLFTRLLKIAESPRFAVRNRYNSIGEVLMGMGIDTIKRFITETALERALRGHDSYFNRFWFHSTTISSLCHKLSARYCPDLSNKAYTMGLFHDVGAIVLLKFDPIYIDLIDNALVFDSSIIAKEMALVGTDHSAIGKVFSQKWALSPTVSEAIEFHHNPDYKIHKSEETKYLKGILQLAELLYGFVSNRGTLSIAPDEASLSALSYIQSMFEIGNTELGELTNVVHEALSETI